MTNEERKDAAHKDYELGMKYKDIADKYDVSINTVKSWKQRNEWERGPNKKVVHPKSKKGAHKVEKVAPKIIEEISANDELNNQRKLFCLYYVQRFNATWAYMQAYGVDYRTANVNGPRLLGNASVREQIDKLRNKIANGLFVTADDIAKEYAKQAFADIGDYVGRLLCQESGHKSTNKFDFQFKLLNLIFGGRSFSPVQILKTL